MLNSLNLSQEQILSVKYFYRKWKYYFHFILIVLTIFSGVVVILNFEKVETLLHAEVSTATIAEIKTTQSYGHKWKKYTSYSAKIIFMLKSGHKWYGFIESGGISWWNTNTAYANHTIWKELNIIYDTSSNYLISLWLDNAELEETLYTRVYWYSFFWFWLGVLSLLFTPLITILMGYVIYCLKNITNE